MSFTQQFSLLACAMLLGCGAPTIAPPVANLVKTPTPVPAVIAESEPKTAPLHYTARKAIVAPVAPAFPRVLLSAGHAKLCLVSVGEKFPAISLPRLGGAMTELTALQGKQATVVLFWHPDRWMARTALVDMQRDIAAHFQAEQVAVVGVAVRQPAGAVQAALKVAQATFPQLIDTEGQAFAIVGTVSLPRLFVLDPNGIIVWFDIEYSEGTRRDLWQTLRVLTKQ